MTGLLAAAEILGGRASPLGFAVLLLFVVTLFGSLFLLSRRS